VTIASLIVDVAANTAKLQTDVSKIQGSFDSLGSMATKVGGLMAGAFTLTAITGAATQILNYAGKIADLSDQTGLSTKAIQEMQHAATVTGASLESFTNAAFKLGTNLSGGSSSVQGAVERLGLSYMQLRQMSPEQQFNTIASALGQVENAQDRNKIAVDLFGKAAKEILPAIAQGYDGIASSAVIAGDAQIHALDAAGDAIDSFWEGLKSGAVQALGSLLLAAKRFDDLDSSVKKNTISTWDWASALEAAGLKSQTFARINAPLSETGKLLQNLPAPLAAASMSLSEMTEAERKLTAQVTAKVEANKKALKAQEDLNRSQERFAASIGRMDTAEWIVPFKRSVEEASFELEELASSTLIAANAFAPLKAAVQESNMHIDGWRDTMRETMTSLPAVIMSAIQGGGSAIAAAGAHIGVSLMSKFQEKFGPLITNALPFGIGQAITALLPALGALFGPVAEKIAGFFKKIFGGPSEGKRWPISKPNCTRHSTRPSSSRLGISRGRRPSSRSAMPTWPRA
jgi:hypothetical protein